MGELLDQYYKTNRLLSNGVAFFLAAVAHTVIRKNNYRIKGSIWLPTFFIYIPIQILSSGVFVNQYEDEKMRSLVLNQSSNF